MEEIIKTFQSFEEMYDYLNSTNDVSVCKYCYDNDGIWKRLSLKWLLEYYIRLEEYEKCKIIKNMMKKHFIANKIKQVELNKKLDKLNSLY